MEDNFILRHAYGKAPVIKVQPWPMPNGQFPPHVKVPNSSGDIVLTESERKQQDAGKIFIKSTDVFELRDGHKWDMSDELQFAIWEAIKYNDVIAKDRTERDSKGNLIVDGDSKRYGMADMWIERPDAITNTFVNKRELAIEAGAYIKNDSAEGIVMKCKLLGHFTESRPINELKEGLYRIADTKPEQIIELYTGSDTNIRLLIIEAIDKKVIEKRDNLFYFGESTLLGGSSVDTVVAYLKSPENKKLMNTIKYSVNPSYVSEEMLSDDDIDPKVKKAGRPAKQTE